MPNAHLCGIWLVVLTLLEVRPGGGCPLPFEAAPLSAGLSQPPRSEPLDGGATPAAELQLGAVEDVLFGRYLEGPEGISGGWTRQLATVAPGCSIATTPVLCLGPV